MAIYKKNTFVSGKWADKSVLYEKGVKRAKIVSETNPEASNYKDPKGNPQTQDVCKAVFEGMGGEALKVSLNNATLNALVEAFGEDSKNWQAHYLALEIDKLPGKKFPLYLIPEGYVRKEDAAGYPIIVKASTEVEPEPLEIINLDEEPGQGESIPF